MNHCVGRAWLAFLALVMFASAAYSADATNDATKKIMDRVSELLKPIEGYKIRESFIDLSVPKSPAFTVLGLTPENVVRPTSPRALAMTLLSGADPRGNIQTGVAADTALYLLVQGNDITLKDYRESYVTRIASRTQLSFATAKGVNPEDEATRVALGLAVTLFDLGDPRNDDQLFACFQRDIGSIHDEAKKLMDTLAPLAATKPTEYETELQKGISPLEEKVKSAAKKCRDERRPTIWNDSAWRIGIAPTWTAPKGNVNNLDWSGAGIWTTIGYGFEGIKGLEDSAQILLHTRRRSKELVPDPTGNGTFFEQDTLTIAGQLRVAGFSFRQTRGGPDFNFLLEAAYVDENRKGRPDEKLFRYTLGFDYRVAEDLYLAVAVVTERGRDHEKNNSSGMIGLKWGFADKPVLNPR